MNENTNITYILVEKNSYSGLMTVEGSLQNYVEYI